MSLQNSKIVVYILSLPKKETKQRKRQQKTYIQTFHFYMNWRIFICKEKNENIQQMEKKYL